MNVSIPPQLRRVQPGVKDDGDLFGTVCYRDSHRNRPIPDLRQVCKSLQSVQGSQCEQCDVIFVLKYQWIRWVKKMD